MATTAFSFSKRLHDELCGVLRGVAKDERRFNMRLVHSVRRKAEVATSQGLQLFVHFIIAHAQSDLLAALPSDTRELWLLAMRAMPSNLKEVFVASGFMEKKGQHFGKKVKRWYVLRPTSFDYYMDETMQGGRRGGIAIAAITSVKVVESKKGSALEVTTGRRTHTFHAVENENGAVIPLAKWVELLDTAHTFRKDLMDAIEYGRARNLADAAAFNVERIDLNELPETERATAEAQVEQVKLGRTSCAGDKAVTDAKDAGKDAKADQDDKAAAESGALAAKGSERVKDECRNFLLEELGRVLPLHRADTHKSVFVFERPDDADESSEDEDQVVLATAVGADGADSFVNVMVRTCPICDFVFPAGVSNKFVNAHVDECANHTAPDVGGAAVDIFADVAAEQLGEAGDSVAAAAEVEQGEPDDVGVIEADTRRCPVCFIDLKDMDNAAVNKHIDDCISAGAEAVEAAEHEDAPGRAPKRAGPLWAKLRTAILTASAFRGFIDWSDESDQRGGFVRRAKSADV